MFVYSIKSRSIVFIRCTHVHPSHHPFALLNIEYDLADALHFGQSLSTRRRDYRIRTLSCRRSSTNFSRSASLQYKNEPFALMVAVIAFVYLYAFFFPQH
jgi:hypothetical protein